MLDHDVVLEPSGNVAMHEATRSGIRTVGVAASGSSRQGVNRNGEARVSRVMTRVNA